MKEYIAYRRLRMGNYFTERVKFILRKGQYEYKLINKNGI